MSNLVVKVHPNVYLGIIDAYERRKMNKGVNDAALGTLLGYYEMNAINITNCYSVPFHVAENDDDKKFTQLDHAMNERLLRAHKMGFPHERVVGWFYTNPKLTEDTALFHEYYTEFVQSVKRVLVPPPLVLLTLDTTFSSKGEPGMPVRAFTSVTANIADVELPPQELFRDLKVVFETSAQEFAAIGAIMKGTESKQREIAIVPDSEAEDKLAEDVLAHMNQMSKWLRVIQKYVECEIKKKPSQRDAAMGRRLSGIVQTAASQLSAEKLEKIAKSMMSDLMDMSIFVDLAKTNDFIVDQLLQLTGLTASD